MLKSKNNFILFGKRRHKDGYYHIGKKIGLALSGGGTRGFAYIGVFKAFEESGIRFDLVAGTSAGSIFGAMYSAKISPDAMLVRSKEIVRKDILDSKFFGLGSNATNIGKVVESMIGEGKNIEDLPIPFCAVTVDLVSGNEVVLNKGSVATAVSASSCVPAIFSPVKVGDKMYVDGGLLNNMPADVVKRNGAQYVISVDLNHTRGKGTSSTKIFNTLLATWNITMKSTMYKGQMNSDIIIEPELAQFKNTELSFIDEMAEEGYRATMTKMPEIKRLLRLK